MYLFIHYPFIEEQTLIEKFSAPDIKDIKMNKTSFALNEFTIQWYIQEHQKKLYIQHENCDSRER